MNQPGSKAVAKRRSKKNWLVVAAFAGALILAAILVVAIAGGIFLLASREEPLTEQDRAVVFDIHDLSPWIEDFEPREEYESIVKTRYFDRSFDVEYEYDDTGGSGVFLSSWVTVEVTVADAAVYYTGARGAVRVGSLFGDVAVEFVERDDLFQWGDKSEFTILESGGKPFGNFFVTRKGKVIFCVIFAGVYFDDAEFVHELLTPTLAQMDAFE